ncbi:MAG TPA: DMT family transporter [Usitatibacter sp.]|nr:DMT family transporter [Usitatibacter sp.]
MPYLALAFVIGFLIPLQAAINARLRDHLDGSTLLAALVSFAVGTLALAAMVVVTSQRWHGITGIANAKAWQLTGGLLGAFFVFATTLLAPKIGLVKMVALVIAGQVVMSIIADHYGWIGLAVREISPIRAAGAALVVAGVVMVNYDSLFGG